MYSQVNLAPHTAVILQLGISFPDLGSEIAAYGCFDAADQHQLVVAFIYLGQSEQLVLIRIASSVVDEGNRGQPMAYISLALLCRSRPLYQMPD